MVHGALRIVLLIPKRGAALYRLYCRMGLLGFAEADITAHRATSMVGARGLAEQRDMCVIFFPHGLLRFAAPFKCVMVVRSREGRARVWEGDRGEHRFWRVGGRGEYRCLREEGREGGSAW